MKPLIKKTKHIKIIFIRTFKLENREKIRTAKAEPKFTGSYKKACNCNKLDKGERAVVLLRIQFMTFVRLSSNDG